MEKLALNQLVGYFNTNIYFILVVAVENVAESIFNPTGREENFRPFNVLNIFH